MNISFTTYLIVCPFVFLAGFVDAIAGGGGIISLPVYMIAGLPVHNALATNKLSSSFGSATATYRYWKSGYIKWKQTIFCIVCAFAGSSLGAKCALMIDDRFFRIIMLIVIPVTAAFLLFRKGVLNEKEPYGLIKTIIISCIIAFFIGFYDGIYGPGTGTFLLILLTGTARITLREANGTAKAINFASNISALTVYLLNSAVIFPLGLAAGAFNLAGSYLGTKCFDKGGVKIVKPVMFFVLAVFFIKIIVELIG
ncbi:MAG: sulfite exporter TauE/SafE family protein [Eubacteriales bacterium]|nr:sulfite exporter TauE/SafE family protein [Eubacteriales bacterium]